MGIELLGSSLAITVNITVRPVPGGDAEGRLAVFTVLQQTNCSTTTNICTTQPIKYCCTLSPFTCIESVDYELINSVVTFPVGSPIGLVKPIAIVFYNDSVVEKRERLLLNLSTTEERAIIGGTTVVNIFDNSDGEYFHTVHTSKYTCVLACT